MAQTLPICLAVLYRSSFSAFACLFVIAAGCSTEDDSVEPHLQSGSPALTAGRDLGDLDNDQDTNETIPSGVYVAGDEVIGRLPEP